tara:strand:- start:175 stop:483 length:309 start_codon:yes stop_codon:yes gene_type:complete
MIQPGKLIVLLLVGLLFSCNAKYDLTGNKSKAEKDNKISNTNKCLKNCKKWCRLGCYAIEGDAKCIFSADKSMPCCDAKAEGLSVDGFIKKSDNKPYIKCTF